MSGTLRYHSDGYISGVPKPDEIELRDIGIGLSRLPAWLGQTKEYYSLAQRSCIVGSRVHDVEKPWALLRESPACYLGIAPPWLRHQTGYMIAWTQTMRAIAKRFHLRWPISLRVRQAAVSVIDLEIQELYTHGDQVDRTIKPVTERAAYAIWMHAAKTLGLR